MRFYFLIFLLSFLFSCSTPPTGPDQSSILVSQNPVASLSSGSNEVSDSILSSSLSYDLSLDYTVYAAGIKGMNAVVKINRSVSSYAMGAEAYAVGWINTLYKFQSHFKSKGKFKNQKALPSSYESKTITGDKIKIKGLHYNASGLAFERYEDVTEGKEHTQYTVPTEQDLAKGTVDVQTALIVMMERLYNTGSCAGSIYAFEGKRRLKLTFYDKGEVYLSKTDYSPFYEGKARICDMRIKSLGGKPLKNWMVDESKTDNAPFTFWMANVQENTPPLPIQIKVDGSLFGSIIMYLQNIK